MKIELIPTGGGAAITLGDDANGKTISGLKRNIIRLKQPVNAIGAAEYDDHDRGNEKTALAFTVRIQYATIAAAAAAWLAGNSIMASKGALKLTEGATVYYVNNASVQSLGDYPLGVSVYSSYSVIGGATTITPPS